MSARPQETNSLLSVLDAIQRQLNELRDRIVRQEANANEFARIESATIAQYHNDDMTQREAASYLGVSRAALSSGKADCECVKGQAIHTGARVRYPRAVLVLHRQMQEKHGSCQGRCLIRRNAGKVIKLSHA